MTKKDIVDFWFVECSPEQWFRKDPKFDKKFTSLDKFLIEFISFILRK